MAFRHDCNVAGTYCCLARAKGCEANFLQLCRCPSQPEVRRGIRLSQPRISRANYACQFRPISTRRTGQVWCSQSCAAAGYDGSEMAESESLESIHQS